MEKICAKKQPLVRIRNKGLFKFVRFNHPKHSFSIHLIYSFASKPSRASYSHAPASNLFHTRPGEKPRCNPKKFFLTSSSYTSHPPTRKTTLDVGTFYFTGITPSHSVQKPIYIKQPLDCRLPFLCLYLTIFFLICQHFLVNLSKKFLNFLGVLVNIDRRTSFKPGHT